jgi:hypothetical protein
MDDAQEFSGTVKGIEQVVVVDTGKRIDRVEAVADEGRNRGLGRRTFPRLPTLPSFCGRTLT